MEEFYSKDFSEIQKMVGQRWVPEIIFTVGHSSARFNEILDEIEVISNTELSRKLNMMTEMGVIKKYEHSGNAYYRLTAFGLDLFHTFKHIRDLCRKYNFNLKN